MSGFLNEASMRWLEGRSLELDVGYLPSPNVVEAVLCPTLAPNRLTPTAFVFAFFPGGDIILPRNRRRGIEVSGGHRDPISTQPDDDTGAPELEHPDVTATREAFEETGAVVSALVPIGFMRSKCTGVRPDGYRYPWPYSCQQFYAGHIDRIDEYTENDECLAPVRLTRSEAREVFNSRTLVLFEEACRTIPA